MKSEQIRSEQQMNSQELGVSGVLAGVYALRMFGLFLPLPVLAFHVAKLAGSDQSLWIGLVMGAYGLTQAFLQLPFGMLSDRWGRKKTIYLGMAIFILGSFLAAIAESPWLLMLARALQGAGAISAVITALMADLIREQVRTRAMAMVGMSIGLTFAISLALSPTLASMMGVEGLFVVTGVAMLLAMWAVKRCVPEPQQCVARNRLPAWKIGLNEHLWRLNFGIFALHAGQMALFMCLPFLLLQMGWEQKDQWQVYAPMVLLGMVLMVPIIIWGERKQQLKRALLLAIALMVLAQAVLAWQIQTNWLVIGALVVYAIAFNLLEAILPSMVAKFAPTEQRGAAMGLYSTAQSLGIFMGGLVGGLILNQIGLNGVFAFATVLMLVWFAVALSGQAPQKRQG